MFLFVKKYSKILLGDMMIDKPKQSKNHLNVLGILIRTTRIQKGYSLRDLAEITNISHTLISNIEKGKQTPSEATLSDIFSALDLSYFEDPELSSEMSYYYKTIMTNIINHDYEQASELVQKMVEKEDVYTNSPELLSYLIVKLLYYSLNDMYVEDRDELIVQYEQVYEFLTDEQKQMFCFIRGIDLLNEDHYVQATQYFDEAITLGNSDWDSIIKEYNVRSLIRQYKFTDANAQAREAIEDLEKRTIYLRAMKCRLLITRVYLQIMNFDKVSELVQYVELFAEKFNVTVLTDECKVLRSWMYYLQEEYQEAVKLLDSCTNPSSDSLILPRFRLYLMSKDERLTSYYKMIMETKENTLTRKKYLLIRVLMMWKNTEVRDDESYLECLTELKELSVKIKDQENIALTHNLLILFYKEKKRYKRALEVAEEFLQEKKIGLLKHKK